MTDDSKKLYRGAEDEGTESWDQPIELVPRTVVVTAEVPTRGFLPWAETRTATYRVNLSDWSCTGEVNGLVLVDETWWIEHCAEVGQRVRAKLQDTQTTGKVWDNADQAT